MKSLTQDLNFQDTEANFINKFHIMRLTKIVAVSLVIEYFIIGSFVFGMLSPLYIFVSMIIFISLVINSFVRYFTDQKIEWYSLLRKLFLMLLLIPVTIEFDIYRNKMLTTAANEIASNAQIYFALNGRYPDTLAIPFPWEFGSLMYYTIIYNGERHTRIIQIDFGFSRRVLDLHSGIVTEGFLD